MEVLVFSDVHGNLPAFQAVLVEAVERQVDSAVCVGDVMGVLGWPQETAKLVRDVTDACVYGNHDAYFRSDYSWVPEHPSQKQEHRVVTEDMYGCVQKWLDDLPEEHTEYYEGKKLHLVHGAPWTTNHAKHKCGYPASNYTGRGAYTKVAAEVDADFVALGHTHQQTKLDCSKFGHDTLVFNPGSVGAPYDEPAQFAILNTEANEVELCSTEYDVQKLKDRFEELDITEDGDYP